MQLGALRAASDAVRAQFAHMVNATPDEIGLLFSTGDGENVIANGVGLKAGDNVVVDDLHYSTGVCPLRALEASRGIELRIVKSRNGAVTDQRFRAACRQAHPHPLSVAWVSESERVPPRTCAPADLAHANGALFYADAVQAAGMINLDVRAAGVDALCSGSAQMVDVGVWRGAVLR